MSEHPDRTKLTFEQAEGLAPLPAQLKPREVSRELRAALWHKIHSDISASKEKEFGYSVAGPPWRTILEDEYVYRQHKMIDDFKPNISLVLVGVRPTFERGNYAAIFGWLEFALKHPSCPDSFADDLEGLLRFTNAAYRIVDRKVICPIGSASEHDAIVRAFADLGSKQFHGARAHLSNAAAQLTAGEYADSVRESIHAVESVSRSLDPSADLSKALARLEQSISIHPAMKKGFTAPYGYTSDQEGIRHALLDEGKAKVDEADTLFMMGACAAFVSYLINKAHSARLDIS